MEWRDLSDPAAFHRYMESVDDRLKADGVEIAGRPVHALGLISGELRLSFTIKDDIALRINRWFEDRYGPRLLIDFSIGSMLVEIREDPYVAKYLLIYGTVTINPLSFIQGVTGGMFAGMAKSDIEELATVIKRGFEAFVSMQKVPPALHSDLTNAVAQLVKRPADAAMSKWSSQQAVEKTLNGFIAGRGRDPKTRPRGTHLHDLLPLVDLAEELGLAHLDRNLVAEVQCSASARYPGRVTVSPKEAIRADQASVNLCGAIGRQWP